MLAQRVVEQSSAASLFAAHSWYTPPPAPPPPPPAAAVNTAPVAPSAPPLPFQFIGSYTPDGQAPVFFLTRALLLRGWHIHGTATTGACPVSASILSTAMPVPIAASRRVAEPIVSSMRLAPNSATLPRIAMMLFFRSLISTASRLSTARTVSLVTWHHLQILFADHPSPSKRTTWR